MEVASHKMASGFSAVTNEEVQSKINEEVVTDNWKKGTKFGLADFTGKPLSVKKNLSMKPVKKVFVCKFKLSQEVLRYFI